MASKLPEYHVVCEGPTDYRVIEAALAAILKGGDFVLQRVQPPESLYGGEAGPYGGGWKGVRAWCQATQAEWGSIDQSRQASVADLLIVHLDAETAEEAEISCAMPCPPASATVELLKHVLLGWMGDVTIPSWVVFCIPSKDTDAWVLAALYPDDDWVSSELECRAQPAERLLNKPEKLVRRREGKLQKHASRFQAISPRITGAWDRIAECCTQAKAFDDDFSAKA